MLYAHTFNKTIDKWKSDIPDLTIDNWEDCMGFYVTNMISSKDRFIQLTFLHKIYYTP